MTMEKVKELTEYAVANKITEISMGDIWIKLDPSALIPSGEIIPEPEPLTKEEQDKLDKEEMEKLLYHSS